MKVIEQLKNAGKTQFSFELLPPLKGHDIENIYKAIDPLIEFNPININVTFHQSEATYIKLDNGQFEKRIVKRRPGTVAISAAISHRYKVPVVTHLICGGHTKADLENILVDLHFLGMDNILALRGDPPKGMKSFIPEPDGHAHTLELVEQIANMNKGIYLEKSTQNPKPTDFCIGVAGYPEKHIEAPNMDNDIKFLKKKVDAGAEYIVTQMFFDNKKYFDFVERCRNAGINVPIVPGVKPIMTLKDINLLPQTFKVDLPNELVLELEKCQNNQDVYRLGIEWTISQSKELIKAGVPAIHFYTISVSENIREIAKAIY
jgi:methylenetetrahydrofolate reductase (NADPH)